MIVDEERGVLIGMTLVGPAVGELIHGATIAIVGAIPISRLWHASHPIQPSARSGSGCWKHTAYEHAPISGSAMRKVRCA